MHMPNQTASQEAKSSGSRLPPRKRKSLAIAGIAILALASIGIVIAARKWPFTRERVAQSLQETLPSTVKFEHFHALYFPYPGYVAEGVIFDGTPAAPIPPLVSIRRMTLQSGYLDLLLRPGFINRIQLEGLQVRIPPRGPAPAPREQHGISGVRVGEIIADGALLEIARHEGNPLRFEIHSLNLRSVSTDTPWSYRLAMRNAIPPGEIQSQGHFGPWKSADPAQTPLSGTYKFEQADLGVFRGIRGTLSAEDKFEGVLGQIDSSGSIAIPDFRVTSSNHEVPVRARYRAVINGINGDVRLEQVDASILQTSVEAEGSIAGRSGQKGKTTSLDLTIRNGRIQDVMRLFIKAPRPPLNGMASFRAHVTIPPEGRPFLQEVQLTGDFGIGGGRFTKPSTQDRVDKLSERAQGEKEEDDPDSVISDLAGHASLRDGVATFSDLSFSVPGALARMHGRYNLQNQKIDLHGTLRTQAEFSHQTTGIKSILLKPFDALFKKKHAGAEIPVQVTGTYSDPHPGLDLDAKR